MEGASERTQFTPFEEILPYAESAAASFLHYLRTNLHAFTEAECREICGVLTSMTDLVHDSDLSSGEAPSVVALLKHFRDLNERAPYQFETVSAVYSGQNLKTVDLSPFALMRIYSNAAAYPLIQMLQKRPGTLSLEDCSQLRLIVSNFSVLLFKGVPDTEHIQALHESIFPEGHERQDAYEMLVENFASPAAKEEHRAATRRALEGLPQPPQRAVPVARKGLRERVLALLFG